MTVILAGLVLAATMPTSLQQCGITLRVTKLDRAAPRAQQREKVVAEPRVVTAFGRPAFFRLGKLSSDTNGITGPGAFRLLDGIEFEVVPLQGLEGRVRLEMQVRPVGAERGFRLVTDTRPGAKEQFQIESNRGTEVMTVEIGVAVEGPRGVK